MHFKTVRLTTICNVPKQTISVSGGLQLFQMVLELDSRRCANEDARPLNGVDCEILHRLERGTKRSL